MLASIGKKIFRNSSCSLRHNFKYTFLQVLWRSLQNFIRNYFVINQHFVYFYYMVYERIFHYMQEEVCVCVCTFACVSMYLLQVENVTICKKINVFWNYSQTFRIKDNTKKL